MSGLQRTGLVVTLALFGVGAFGAQESDGQGFACLLEPHLLINVGSPATGVLESVSVDRGDTVRKGQVIARLQFGAEQATVDLAAAKAQFDQRQVARNEDLYRDELISINDKDQMETQSQVSQLELVEATERLKLRTIRSPISGIVVERFLSPGEFVQEAAIMTLAQIDPLNVEVILPVAEFGNILNGSVAEVQPASPVGGTYPARAVIVDRVVDAASGTFGVRLELPNPGNRIPAGLQCRVVFSQ